MKNRKAKRKIRGGRWHGGEEIQKANASILIIIKPRGSLGDVQLISMPCMSTLLAYVDAYGLAVNNLKVLDSAMHFWS